MKKLLLPIVIICSLWLITGCAAVTTTGGNTLKRLAVETDVKPLPITADLKVSEQKARGEASGLPMEEERLTNLAVARALGQDPPSPLKPDVLVGMYVFREWKGAGKMSNLKITVTGYPAFYTNFRSVEEGDSAWVIMPGGIGMAGGGVGVPTLGMSGAAGVRSETVGTVKKGRKTDNYYAVRWQVPVTSPASAWWAFNVENGWVWDSGVFFGIDLGLGNKVSHAGDVSKEGYNVGAGFNIGGIYDLPVDDLQLVYGGSLGYWHTSESKYNKREYYNEYYRDRFLFGGPFVKLRWHGIELSYRGLVGITDKVERESKSWDDDDYYWGLGYHSQLTLGYHFVIPRKR
jgi:uncharacterized protein YceK